MNLLKPYRFHKKTYIEQQANRILQRMHATENFAPTWPFDGSLVADFLDLGVVWDVIEPDEQGAIAARILPRERLIEINEEILDKPQGFIESTLAHEIGHWILHVDQEAVRRSRKNTDEAFVCRAGNTDAQIASIEWQAQYFASCLLMPRYVLEQKRIGRNLMKWSDLYALRQELGVSISNLVRRLQDLGWIHVPPGERTIYPGSEMLKQHQNFLNGQAQGQVHSWWMTLKEADS
ncbi:MAG: ImmA/IrrE family metallo-endopeptidase [Cyanobacteriota bacterium]|nr:ImmA/IrrE family metallo-endopeptidase [Cyanobacteriota bacterium]